MDIEPYSLTLREWLYVFAAGLGLATLLLGLALLVWSLRRRAPLDLAAASFLAVAGAAGLAAVWLAASERTAVQFLGLDIGDLFGNVVKALVLAAAVLAAFSLTSGALVLGLRERVRWRRAALLAGGGLILVGGVLPGLLWAVDDLEQRESRGHPAGTDTSAPFAATLIVDGLEFPTGLAVGPAGEIFFSELSGRIGVVLPSGPSGEPEVRLVSQVPLPEGGLLFHIALHPDWPATPYLYASKQHEIDGRLYLQLIRVELDGYVGGKIEPLAGGLPTPVSPDNHYGSAIAVCAGHLFLTVGDTDWTGDPTGRSQDPSDAAGKVLRYRLDGADLVPAGTLHDDPPVFAMGFRNPFAASCDPVTGFPVVADNGPASNDQVRLVAPSSNHEWPFSDERSLLTPPLYDTRNRTVAPTGVVTRGLEGDVREVFFTVFNSASVYRFTFVEAGITVSDLKLAHGGKEPGLSATLGPDGCVYFSTLSAIWRLDEPGCAQPAPGAAAASP